MPETKAMSPEQERLTTVQVIVGEQKITLGKLANAVGVHYTTLHRWMVRGLNEVQYHRIMRALERLAGGEAVV